MARRGASVKAAARLRADEATRELREAQSRKLALLGAAAQGYFEAAERRERAQVLVEQEEVRAQEALCAVRELVETNRAAAELCGVSVYDVTAAVAAVTSRSAPVPKPGPASVPVPVSAAPVPVAGG